MKSTIYLHCTIFIYFKSKWRFSVFSISCASKISNWFDSLIFTAQQFLIFALTIRYIFLLFASLSKQNKIWFKVTFLVFQGIRWQTQQNQRKISKTSTMTLITTNQERPLTIRAASSTLEWHYAKCTLIPPKPCVNRLMKSLHRSMTSDTCWKRRRPAKKPSDSSATSRSTRKPPKVKHGLWPTSVKSKHSSDDILKKSDCRLANIPNISTIGMERASSRGEVLCCWYFMKQRCLFCVE